MNWLDQFLGKREDKSIEVKEDIPFTVNFDGINVLLNKELEKQLKPFKANVKKEYSNIQTVVDELKNSLNALEKAELEGELDPRQKHLVFTHRANLINKINRMLNSFEFPVELGYESTIDFYNSFIKALNYASKKIEKDFRPVNIYFKKQSREIIEQLKRLDYQSKSLCALLKVKKDFFTNIEDSSSYIRELQNTHVTIEKNQEKLKIHRSELKKLKEKQRSIEIQIEKLLNSKEWANLIKLREKREKIENNINELKNDINSIVYSFDKLFRKFRKLVYDEKEQFKDKKFIDSYINSPVDCLESDKEMEIIHSILEHIKRCILSNTIELRNKKREKALNQINDVLEKNILKSLQKKYQILKNDRYFIDIEISNIKIDKERGILEKKLSEIKRDIETSETNMEKIKRDSERLKNKIDGMKKLLEKKLGRIINKKVKIMAG